MKLKTLICVSKYVLNASKSVLIIGVPTENRERKCKRPKEAKD